MLVAKVVVTTTANLCVVQEPLSWAETDNCPSAFLTVNLLKMIMHLACSSGTEVCSNSI